MADSEKLIDDIKVVDVTGKVLINKNIHSNHGQIDFSVFPNGVYFIKIMNSKGQEISNKKVVKLE